MGQLEEPGLDGQRSKVTGRVDQHDADAGLMAFVRPPVVTGEGVGHRLALHEAQRGAQKPHGGVRVLGAGPGAGEPGRPVHVGRDPFGDPVLTGPASRWKERRSRRVGSHGAARRSRDVEQRL
jgi:hypothetical protein